MSANTSQQTPPVQTPAEDSTIPDHRLDILGSLDCMRGVPPDELQHLVDLGYLRAFLAGDTIISEHKPGEFFYILLNGTVRLTLHDREHKEVLLGVLGAGDCCGEGMLFSDFFRHAGAFAETPCYTLQLPLVEVRSLLSASPHLNDALHRIHLRRLVEGTLAHGTLFSKFLPVERLALAALLQPVHFERGSTITECDEPGNALYIIEAGQVGVEKYDELVAYLEEGDFFGEIALFCSQHRSATVRAITPVDILILPAERFHSLLQQHPELETRLREVIAQRQSADADHPSRAARTQYVQRLVAHGLRRGTHLLVRTPSLCPPGCTLCEQACARRFGNTRLHLNGVRQDHLDILDSCRQCRVGAECAEVCPEHAFEWSNSGALIITDKCTGCGDCVPACPYDAVVRVPTSGYQGNGLKRLWNGFKKALIRQQDDLFDERYTPYLYRADKCDLCDGFAEMACVAACPADSLHFVPIDEIVPH